MLPSPDSLILVAVMNNRRDFEIARLLGWYRIPLRSAPKVIAVDYLAFYQTSAFGEHQGRIEYLAPVKGYELTTRAELLRDEVDHPNADMEYYRIQLGPLTKLPKPILAGRWRRITFFYSTGKYLSAAETINDLVIAAEDRPVLWRDLRERQKDSEHYRSDEGDELPAELLAEMLEMAFSPGFKHID